MAQHSFPGPGHDGDEPVPGVPARDGADDAGERYLDYLAAEIEAGREEAPPEEPPPAVMVYLGEAGDADLAGLAGAGFAQHQAADVMPPGPVLGALTGQAVQDLTSLDDNELLGVVSAARRQQTRAEYEELAAVAEFTRRREQQYEASKARGDKPRHRDGEFAAEELGMELSCSHYSAGQRMDLAGGLSSRLPAELRKKAARLEMKLDPDGVRQRKEEAARKHRRVEARQEGSGNACLSGRELDVADALAAKNSVWEEAARLREAGLDVPLREARSIVYLDRLQNQDPWQRLTPPNGDGSDDHHDPGSPDVPGDPRPDGPGERGDDVSFPDDGYDENEDGLEDEDSDGEDRDEDDGGDSGPGGPEGGPPLGGPGSPVGKTPLPALITITVSDGTLLGWSDAPAEVSGFGLLDPDAARDLITAAGQHPRTRWCVTVTGKDGEAVAHGCASGRHPWTPENPRDGTARAGPGHHQRAQLAALLRQLGVAPAPIAKGTCDHAQREDRYRPSRQLRHLVRARTATCPAPGCGAQAIHNELDHTVPYPAGMTDQCDLSPPCARHHHAKHAPGWKLQQPQPGVMRWTPPSGRVYITWPTRYDE